ncbi:MAG TPA: hypothetical protein VGE97_03525 [Nitrososphaera sp.]
MSSANLGGAFTGSSHYSPNRVNAGKWFIGTGAEIAAIPNTQQMAAAICVENGSGFIAGVGYYSQYDSITFVRTGWLPFLPKHLHNADDDISGGLLSNIRNANMGLSATIDMAVPKANQFTINKTGTNANITDEVATDLERLKISTGSPSVANDLVTGTKAGLKVNWGKPIYLQLLSEIVTGTSMFARTGTGIERVDQSTDDRIKMGLEDCSISTANRQIVTADGNTSSRTLVTTTEPSASGTAKSHKLILNPGIDVKYYVNGVLNTSKGNNIPSTGACDRDRVLRVGIKTTDVNEKIYRVYALALYYVPNDTWY